MPAAPIYTLPRASSSAKLLARIALRPDPEPLSAADGDLAAYIIVRRTLGSISEAKFHRAEGLNYDEDLPRARRSARREVREAPPEDLESGCLAFGIRWCLRPE